MMFGPLGAIPLLVLPDDASEATELVRPVLVAGPEPTAVVILLDIDVRGAGD